MGSGTSNAGYVEMWGGTSQTYPDARQPLGPGASIQWTEWMYPYQQTRGLDYADEDVAINFQVVSDVRRVVVGLCPSGAWSGSIELWRGSDLGSADEREPLRHWEVTANPEQPFFQMSILQELMASEFNDLRLRVGSNRSGWIVVD